MQPYQPCGTEAAARRHYRAGEKPCQACLEANRAVKRRARGVEPYRELAPAVREVRNGLPPFRPYRYRGTGADAYTGEVVVL